MRLALLIGMFAWCFAQDAAGSDFKEIVKTSSLAAPEANQAAAADHRFVFGVGSAVVAKYDRLTGKRVALSSGGAKHLNSGFLWDGKLLCAHSNFPNKPERSEIMVLDS